MSPRRILPILLRIGRRVRASLFAPSVSEEVREELDFHVRMRARDLEAKGLDPDAARRAAEQGLQERERIEAECRALGEQREGKMRRTAWTEALGQDVAFAARQILRHRGFAATVILTLALGIGANTAVFSAVRGVLLRPLPYREPDRLVALNTRYLPISGYDVDRFSISIPELRDYREATRALAAVAPYTTGSRTLGGDEGIAPLRVGAAFLAADVLPVLGVEPLHGRAIAPEDDVPGAAPVAVLSHDLWTSRFGADPEAIGRSVTVSGTSARIVGVMPEGFVFPTADQALWLPLGLDWSDDNRAGHFLNAVGRLAPNATLEQAGAELATIADQWAADHQHNIGHFMTVAALRTDLVGDARERLILLQAAVLLVLLIACVNVANLTLARGEARRQEIAVRASLGAGRARIVRQLLTESLVLAAVGSALAWPLAAWGAGLLLDVAPDALPRGEAVRMDAAVFLFMTALAMGAAVLFGALPAARAALSGPATELIGAGRGSKRGARRAQGALVAAEVALSLMVVIAAGLIGRSLIETMRMDPGFVTEGLLVADITLPTPDYPEAAQVESFYAGLETRLRALPGVSGVSAVSALPLTGRSGRWDFFIEGRAPQLQGERVWNAFPAAARPDYFETAGIPLMSGRTIEPADRADAEPVVWINTRTAELFWPGENPMGARVRFTDLPDAVWFRVVGTVGVTSAVSLRDEAEPQVYFAHAQMELIGGPSRGLSLVVRRAGDPAELAPDVRAAVRALDPRLPAPDAQPIDQLIRRSVAGSRLVAWLLGAFGALALLLAAVGVYGVASYSVVRRTREIGIRIALGARAGRVAGLVLHEGVGPALVGVAIGLSVAALAAPRLEGLLFKVSPRDPVTAIATATLLLVVATLATWLPARRALRIAPTDALREE